MSARIRDDLLNRAKEFYIMLEDVSIVRNSHAFTSSSPPVLPQLPTISPHLLDETAASPSSSHLPSNPLLGTN